MEGNAQGNFESLRDDARSHIPPEPPRSWTSNLLSKIILLLFGLLILYFLWQNTQESVQVYDYYKPQTLGVKQSLLGGRYTKMEYQTLEGARVDVFDQQGKLLKTSYTNYDGIAGIGVQNESYILVSKEGYENQTINLTNAGNKGLIESISGYINGEGSIKVYLRSQGALGAEVFDAVSQSSGIRPLSGVELKVYVNGKLRGVYYTDASGSVHITNIPLEDYTEIEASKAGYNTTDYKAYVINTGMGILIPLYLDIPFLANGTADEATPLCTQINATGNQYVFKAVFTNINDTLSFVYVKGGDVPEFDNIPENVRAFATGEMYGVDAPTNCKSIALEYPNTIKCNSQECYQHDLEIIKKCSIFGGIFAGYTTAADLHFTSESTKIFDIQPGTHDLCVWPPGLQGYAWSVSLYGETYR